MSLVGIYWRTVFRSGTRRVIRGVEVSVVLTDGPPDQLFHRVGEALDLIATYDPRQIRRIRQLTSGILVFGTVGYRAVWQRQARLIRLLEKTVASDPENAAHIASDIIHEAMHAWLEHRGFEYIATRRQRIEAICIKAEARFARKIPGGVDLAQYYDDQAQAVLEQPDSEWDDGTFKRRDLDHLRELGAPKWLLRLVERRVRKLAG